MIRIFSIEDHWLVTEGLRAKFRRSRNKVTITCSAENIEDAISAKSDELFDIILLDLFIPNTDPIDNIRTIMTRYPGKPIVILTGEEQEIWRIQVSEAGVVAYLTKHATKKSMVDTLKRVFNGENILKGQIAEYKKPLAGRENNHLLLSIKPSEKEILSMLARGNPQKQVAETMHISESALEKRLGKIRRQFSVSSTLELIRMLEKYRFLSDREEGYTGC